MFALLLVAGACSSKKEPNAAPDTTTTAPTTEVVVGCNSGAVAKLPYHVAYAKNDGQLPIYEAPSAPTPMMSLDQPRLTDTDPPVDIPLTFLIKDEPTTDDCQWMEVYLPERPNFSTGWVKRADVEVEAHSYRVEVNLSDFNLKAYEGDKLVLDVPVGVGEENHPTPGGTYYITELLQPPDPNGTYGPYAFGLSGHSEKLESFNGGKAQLGIHGTNQPDKIGTNVSSGCIRLHNEDITTLANLLRPKNGQGQETAAYYGVPVQVTA